MGFLIARLFFWTIGIMFLVGSVGSALVVLLTTLDDVKELSGGTKESESTESSPPFSRLLTHH
jgi:hypothetical protein